MEQGLLQDADHSWPELQGKKYDEAEKAIKDQFPHLQVHKVLEGSPVTMDFRPERVRIHVNKDNVVVDTPRTG